MYKIIIQTSFPGFHHWPTAPEKFHYLRHVHRHVFHVRAEMIVTHDNRDIEFIDLKNQVEDFIRVNYSNQTFTYSCEQISKTLSDIFHFDYVEVLEDNENGGSYTKVRSCKCSTIS